MLDTHAVARPLTDAEFTPAQADAITDAVAAGCRAWWPSYGRPVQDRPRGITD